MRTITIVLLTGMALSLTAYGRSDQPGQVGLGDISGSSEVSTPVVRARFVLPDQLPDVPTRMTVYRTVEPRISRQDITRLMEALDLRGEIIESERMFAVRDGDRVLEACREPHTGYLRYCDDGRLSLRENVRDLPSESEAINTAKQILDSYGFLPRDTFLAGSGYFEFCTLDSRGDVIDHGKNALGVGFGFRLDGWKVEGPGAKAGVVFGENGQVIAVSRIWRETYQDRTAEIITSTEALARFKERWPAEESPDEAERTDILTTIDIGEMYLAYFAEPGLLPQQYLKPVYIFKGGYSVSDKRDSPQIHDSGKFHIMVPATADR
jgi:hypothetical protein